jgi:hypothetical protein
MFPFTLLEEMPLKVKMWNCDIWPAIKENIDVFVTETTAAHSQSLSDRRSKSASSEAVGAAAVRANTTYVYICTHCPKFSAHDEMMETYWVSLSSNPSFRHLPIDMDIRMYYV